MELAGIKDRIYLLSIMDKKEIALQKLVIER